MLSLEEIKAAKDQTRELVEIPEWNGSVYVGVMSGRGREAWERFLTRDNPLLRAATAVYSVVDENGKPLFTEADLEWLNEKSFVALNRIFEVARRVNKFGPEEQEALEKK